MILKLIGCDSDECGADAVGGIGEKEVVADWFDVEVDGGTDQELIVLVDGVIAFGEAEAIGTVSTDLDVITLAAVEEIIVITAVEPVVVLLNNHRSVLNGLSGRGTIRSAWMVRRWLQARRRRSCSAELF